MTHQLPLVATGVTKSFGGAFGFARRLLPWTGPSDQPSKRVVDDVSFRIERGEVYGIIGANGSGKSTLIRILSTLLLPDAGEVRIFGRDVVRDSMAVRGLINRVSANPSFFRNMSVVENLLFFGRAHGLGPQQGKERTPALLDRLGLEWERATVPMTQLSRGEQQKVAVVRCFLSTPVLMLLDEPTTGLDPRSKREVQRFILEAQREQDATILLTTHDMDEAESLCNRLSFLSGGRIVAEGSPLELRQRVARSEGLGEATMESVFMTLTGRSIEDNDRPEREMIDA
jgi:ABC-2 type transport system ATP-binding protein